MNISTWIAIYLPIIIIFFIVIPSNNRKIAFILRLKRKKKGRNRMSNSMIESLIGKEVMISTGSIGSSYDKVTVVEVVDNWMKVEKKGKIDLINIDFIQGIKIKED
jgi:hypothetical protein